MVCYLSLASTNVLDKNKTKPNVYFTISKYVSNLQTNITDIPQAQTLAIKLTSQSDTSYDTENTLLYLRNNSCRPYFIVIQIWVGIIFMNI